MKIKFGIVLKLFFWYLITSLIFYATIVILFVHIRGLVKVSEYIANRNYRIATASRKMIDSLLSMAENQKKYDLLKKEDYKAYFTAAQKEYEYNLVEILWFGGDEEGAKTWEDLYSAYQDQFVPKQGQKADSDVPWIQEDIINDWVDRISKARAANEQQIVNRMRSLNERGRTAVKWGFVGLATSLVVGLLAVLGISFSMNRPLRELRRGIKALSRTGLSEPIRIYSNDEFGELAGAFNDMAARLTEEERMRSDFISMLSHEIRTPLTSIRESVNLIIEEVMGNINEKQRRFLEIASGEIERITKLLDHLMQISRLEAGAIEINPRRIEPAQFVHGTISRVIPAAEAKEIAIKADIADGVPEFYADPDNLQQVLLNLLGNAIKFSLPGGEIRVGVELGESSGGPEVVFSVSDTGAGIPEEELSLVFHKYYRASGVRDHVDGVGLGLSISKNIVEAHGGRITVSSKPGAGSTFSFMLPVSQKEPNDGCENNERA